LVVLFGLCFVLGSLVGISLKAAVWWFVAFTASVVYAVVIPGLMDPIYGLPDPATDAAFNVVATGIVVLAALAYFAHQRDRFIGDPTTYCTTSSLTRSLIGSRPGR
jgi:hypothetical protein